MAVTMNKVKELLKNELKHLENNITSIISSNFTILSERLSKIEKIIDKNSRRIKDIEDEIEGFKDSLTFQSDIMDQKFGQIKNDQEETIKELKEKQRQMEDRSRRNNLRIDGISEHKNETWKDCEDKVLNLFEHKLGVKDAIIERAHRSGVQKQKKPRTIVLKLLNYKDKEKILKECSKLKGMNIFVYEDFSKETVKIRKLLWDQIKRRRENGERLTLRYDRIVRIRDNNLQNKNGGQ